jgi:hypothetical protein
LIQDFRHAEDGDDVKRCLVDVDGIIPSLSASSDIGHSISSDVSQGRIIFLQISL